MEIDKNQETKGESVQQAWASPHSSHPLAATPIGIFATCETRRLRAPESGQTGQGLIAQNPPQDGLQTRATSGLGFAKQAAAAGAAGGGSRWQQAGSGSKQVGLASRTVLRAANRSHTIMAGSKARGRRGVAVWLTSSAVSIYIATDRLHSSPLVQSLSMRRTPQRDRKVYYKTTTNRGKR